MEPSPGFHVASTRLNDLDVKKTSIGYISISQLYVTIETKNKYSIDF